MNKTTFGKDFLLELESEVPASRKCLERIPEKLFNWKPHETSVKMGDLVLVVADIPKWISTAIKEGEIDFGSWETYKLTTTEDLLKYFDKNIYDAKMLLKNVSDKDLEKMFSLKDRGTVLMSSTKRETIGSSLNHLVHHRGQLTVYMRMNDIPVPSIYGPSGDDLAWR